MSKPVNIFSNNGQWSIFSIDCIREKVIGRKSLRKDSQACDACFNHPFLSQIKFRIRRMESTLYIEQYLMESKSSVTGYLAVSKFLKRNLSSASEETLTLINRCTHYQTRHIWMQKKLPKLKQYDAVDENGKIVHEK